MAKRTSVNFSPLNLNNQANEKRTKFVDQINSIDLKNLQQEMENDKTTPGWAKQLLTHMHSLLILATEIITDNNSISSKQQIDNFQQEQEEKERKHCLVLTGLDESTLDEPIERAAEDQRNVYKVLNSCQLDCTLPNGIFRMGRKSDKPRPIKIKFPCQSAVKEVLKNKNKIKLFHKNLNLRESLSRSDLEARSAVIKKCGEMRKANPGLDYIVYAGEVIERKDILTFRQTFNKKN